MSVMAWTLAAITALTALIVRPSYGQYVPSGNEEQVTNDRLSLEGFFEPSTITDEQPSEYFTIDEGQRPKSDSSFSLPMALVEEGLQKVQQLAAQGPRIVLTRWLKHNSSPSLPTEKYNRKYHFGTWINDPTDDTCLNTRAKVLVRDSRRPVTYRANNHCSVDSGLWSDPYTGRVFTSTKDIQIDHVVPLKHAYQTGAWRWNYQTRCLYANFMANSYHLLSVSGHENMSKGDKSPDQYMPPNSRASCGYLQAWLQIKLTWKLVMFPGEAESIREIMNSKHCNENNFAMDRTQLEQQRRAMNQALSLCRQAPPSPKQSAPKITSELN